LSGHRKSGAWRTGKLVVAMAAAAFVAACSSASKGPATYEHEFTQSKMGVKASPRVASGSKIPEGGGRYMVGKPYKVAGKTYVPKENMGYTATGQASWYGRRFHGRKTANGEVYDMADLTAAHPTLPLPSYARVTNLSNGRSVVVRVNDRGPFSSKRVIDVSATVADMLDFKRAGTAKVKVDYVGLAPLDGKDRKMLLATYQAPGRASGNTMVASGAPANPRVFLASAPVKSRRDPTGFTAPEPLTAAPEPAIYPDDDPLGPLILRSSYASSYLSVDRFSGAHEAAASLAASNPANQVVSTVQLGVFAGAGNAERIGLDFRRFGRVTISEKRSGDQSLQIVRVAVAADMVEAVLAAAGDAGLPGAFVLPH
jgi:rare lipoprotein A